jgi:non-specific serine/threonine protein kinase/serine/threonine-protein kinase
VPKVIDFGMATSPADPASDVGRMSGTPEYMSPEQAGSGPPDIDTRTDIFSLGLMLYELVAACPRPQALAALRHARALPRQPEAADFPPPDRHVRLLPADERAALAEARSTAAGRLAAEIGPDLSAVVMKALRRDRELRYDTAAQLSIDLQAWLDRRPVSAVPHTRPYLLRAFVRRNRPAVALSACLGAALLAGVVGTTSG